MNLHKIEDRRNVDQAAGQAAKMQDLLFARFGRLVLGRDEIASVLGLSVNALKIQEMKARGRGEQLLPPPLVHTARGHQWSVSQIARWLAGDMPAAEVERPGAVQPRPSRRRGRPRAEDRGARR